MRWQHNPGVRGPGVGVLSARRAMPWGALLLCGLLCALVLVIATPLAQADGAAPAPMASLVLEDQRGTYPLNGVARFYRDEQQQLTLDDFLRMAPATLTATEYPARALGISDSAYWFRLSLHNQSQRESWLFTARFFGNGAAEVYLLADGDPWQRVGGIARMQGRHFITPLLLKPDTRYEMVVRSVSPGPDKFGFFIVDDADEQTFAMWENRWLGLFYGGLGTLILYNFFVALSMRSATYGFYVIYLISMFTFLFTLDGFGMIFFWGESAEWSMSSYYIFVALLVFTGCQFARLFLDTRRDQPGIDYVLIGLMGISALFILIELALPHNPHLIGIIMVVASLYAVIILVAGLVSYLRGNRMARYFLIAWIFPEAGILYTTAMYAGLLPFDSIGFNIVHATSLIEAILLSMALADRINILREERENAVMASRNRLQAANQELARANDLKDAFLATISHELRTPMNGVIASLELLKQRNLGAEDYVLLNTMGVSSETMLNMVERILRFSELQSGKAVVAPKAVHFPSWLKEFSHKWQTRCAEKQLEWHCDNQLADLSGVVMDDVKVTQVLDELLANAVKFSVQGRVTLTIQRNPDERLCFCVDDTGIGIPPEKHAEIFESFHQVQSSFNRQFGGLGIGLTLAREMARLLGGELRLQARDFGARFEFLLACPQATLEQVPAAAKLANSPPALTPVVPGADEADSRLAPLLVLIVEDNPVNQMVMKKILAALGHSHRLAADGVEAVQQAQQQRFDLILMDCQMPNMDGFDAARLIRQAGSLNQQTPIVAVTANAMEGDRQRCLDAGMNDYLKKPVKPVMIQQAIEQWVYRSDQAKLHTDSAAGL